MQELYGSMQQFLDVLRPSQQQWSYRDVASIFWDFNPTLGCHDTQNVIQGLYVLITTVLETLRWLEIFLYDRHILLPRSL